MATFTHKIAGKYSLTGTMENRGFRYWDNISRFESTVSLTTGYKNRKTTGSHRSSEVIGLGIEYMR